MTHIQCICCAGITYHMTTTHVSRPLLTLACLSVHIACTSQRIGWQPAIPARSSEGQRSYQHLSCPGDHGRHVRDRALPGDLTGIEVDLRPVWCNTGRADRSHQQRPCRVCVCTTHVTQQQSPPYVWVYVHVHHPMYDKMISCMSPVGGCVWHRIVPY